MENINCSLNIENEKISNITSSEASSNEIEASKFRRVGKNTEGMETISRPILTYWQDVWRRIKENRVAFIGLIIIIVYIFFAIVGPAMSKYDYQAMDSTRKSEFISADHWFGTDELGRDLWTRVWRGARISLAIGFISTILNTVIGGFIGGIAGYYGGAVDMIIMRVVDVLYGIPYIIVAILVMVVLGTGVAPLIIAMIIVGWIGSARFIRGEILRLKEQDFVAAARVLGVSDLTIIIKHIIPNIMGLIITNLTMAVPSAIFSEAFLSYIGLGIAPPECSWGLLAKSGVKMLRIYPYQLFIPAFFICTTMLAMNLLGNGLRDALDPRMRGTE